MLRSALRCPLSKLAEFPEKLQPLFEPSRYKVLRGGRGGAKSWGIARALLIQGAAAKLRIGCGREIQKIADSVHQLLKNQILDLGLEQFYKVFETYIEGKNGTLPSI
jgi:phage terminase large subunit